MTSVKHYQAKATIALALTVVRVVTLLIDRAGLF